MKKEEIVDAAKVEGLDLVQMYQAGFLDGYRRGLGKIIHRKELPKLWKKIAPDCIRAFEFRFVNKIQKELGDKK